MEDAQASNLVVGDDGRARCPWGISTADYLRYHDTEWGRPTTDEGILFEKICLEGFQSGLSWLTILRKRENFRAAFAHFEPSIVAAFDETDVERLLTDAGIIRHRGKINATINNARVLASMHCNGETLSEVIWNHCPPLGPAPQSGADVPATTTESAALAKDLKHRGFQFIGPTTAYAAMQAMGLVNDHIEGCWVRTACLDERPTPE